MERMTASTKPTELPLFDVLGQPHGGLLFAADISTRKTWEQVPVRLMESERAARSKAEASIRSKDQLLSVVSHELRAPVATVLGWSRHLSSGGLSAEESAEAVDAIVRGSEQLKELVDQLFDVCRGIWGKLPIELAPTDLTQLSREAVADFARQAQEARIDFSAELPIEAAQVMGDHRRLRHVLANLLSNAIKFTPEGGRVQLSMRSLDGYFRVSVRDTGIGISPEVLPTLFQSFFQAIASTTRRSNGLGIGLALVRHLIELHGGSVRVESEGEGKGAMLNAIKLSRISAFFQAFP